MLDLAAIRADTPAAQDRIFLDSAGSSLPPRAVLDTMTEHLRREAEVGGYRAAEERADDLAAVPASVAAALGAQPGSIALVDSATRAWAQFLSAVPLRSGDRVFITGAEYASNAIMLLQRVRSAGILVEVVPSDAAGRVDLDALASMLDERVRLISLVHVPSAAGLVNPVRPVVDLAREHGALVLLDACQSAGQCHLDITELGVDALSGTGRKWVRGPRGTGFLWVRPELATTLEPAVLDLHGGLWSAPDQYEVVPDATRFQLWEGDIAGRLGLGVAMDLWRSLGTREVEAAVVARAARLRAGLADLAGVRVLEVPAAGPDPMLSGIVTFTIDGVDPARARAAFFDQGIVVSVAGAASTLLHLSALGVDAAVRMSPHYFVTDEQIDTAVAAVAALRP